MHAISPLKEGKCLRKERCDWSNHVGDLDCDLSLHIAKGHQVVKKFFSQIPYGVQVFDFIYFLDETLNKNLVLLVLLCEYKALMPSTISISMQSVMLLNVCCLGPGKGSK